MRYWETLLEQQREGLTVIVDKSWEDIHPRDLFDDSVTDINEICTKIDRGDLDWFMLRARVMYGHHELASELVGGFLYENAAEVLTDGVADDLIWSALQAARREIPILIEGLSAVSDDSLSAELYNKHTQ